MIQITPDITIPESELEFSFVRSSGPGGQNVNKVATAVQLRFDVENSPFLPPEVKNRLARIAGRRMTQAGVLIIDARRSRSQEDNREDAVERFVQLVKQASKKPRVRRKTRPTKASKQRRLDEKRRRSELKKLRRPPS